MRWILKGLLFVALAGLPLWAALLLAGNHLPETYREREMAAWIVLFGGAAVAVACAVSTLLTTIGFVGYHVASGGRLRKALVAIASTFAGGVLVAIALASLGIGIKHQVASKAGANADLEARVLEFVRADDSARRFAGGTPKYDVLGTYREHDGRRIEYTVLVEGTAKFRAAVDVDHATDPPTLRLACVTPMDQHFMDTRDDRCARADAMMRALDFARAHPEPRAEVGGEPVYALVGEERRPQGGFEYHVDVVGDRRAWAVVRTDPGGQGLVLACVSTKRRGMGGFESDPCAADVPAEEYRVLDLVAASAEVVQAVGAGPQLQASMPVLSVERPGVVQHVVTATGATTVFAVVDADRNATPSTLSLRCVATTFPKAGATRDLCDGTATAEPR